MSLSELRLSVGCHGTYPARLGKAWIRVRVKVLDARTVYGRDDLRVSFEGDYPGAPPVWVEASQFIPDPPEGGVNTIDALFRAMNRNDAAHHGYGD